MGWFLKHSRIGHLGINMTFSILNRLLTFALIAKNIILYSESVLDEKNRFKKPVSVKNIFSRLAWTSFNSEISFELEIFGEEDFATKSFGSLLPQVWNVKATFITTASDIATCHIVKADCNYKYFELEFISDEIA